MLLFVPKANAANRNWKDQNGIFSKWWCSPYNALKNIDLYSSILAAELAHDHRIHHQSSQSHALAIAGRYRGYCMKSISSQTVPATQDTINPAWTVIPQSLTWNMDIKQDQQHNQKNKPQLCFHHPLSPFPLTRKHNILKINQLELSRFVCLTHAHTRACMRAHTHKSMIQWHLHLDHKQICSIIQTQFDHKQICSIIQTQLLLTEKYYSYGSKHWKNKATAMLNMLQTKKAFEQKNLKSKSSPSFEKEHKGQR